MSNPDALQPSQAAFTLIELLTVLAIVAILGTLALPSYQAALCKARRAEAKAVLLSLMQQQEQVYAQRSAYVAFSADSSASDARQFKWFSGATPATSAYEIEASACTGRLIAECIALSAHPGTSNVNPHFLDRQCGTLRIDSYGRKTADGEGCW